MITLQDGSLPKLPLIVAPDNRDNTTLKDAKLVNGFVEKTAKGDLWVYKRPGLKRDSLVNVANGYGVFNWNGNVYSIFGNKLYKDGIAITGTVDTTNGVYSFSSCLGEVPKLFFHNAIAAYTYDTTNGLVVVGNATPVTFTGNTTLNSAVVTNITSTAGYSVGDAITDLTNNTTIPVGTSIKSVDSATQITLTGNALATHTGVSLRRTPFGIPLNLVKGSGYIDGYMNVMTQNAAIYSSDPNTPNTWNPLNYLFAQLEPDKGVYLTRQLAYIVAMKTWSTEVFYDAGNAVASPLGPVQGAKATFGCRHAGTVRELDGCLFWVSTTRGGALNVARMEGLRINLVATPAIERILQTMDFTKVYSWAANIGGHHFYAVTSVVSNITIVYDKSTGEWAQWTDTNGNYLPIVDATFSNTQQALLQHETGGDLYILDSQTYLDDGAQITFDLVTPNYDANNRLNKYLKRMLFEADQTAGSVLQLRVSNDDYTSWSNFRKVDLSVRQPILTDCGSFKRRAFHFRHTVNTPLRIKGVEMHMDIGTL